MFSQFVGGVLTQNTSFFIGPISQFFGFLMNAIYNFFGSTFGFYSLGFSIVVFTIIARILMIPLAIKQQKSMREMQLVQPELQKIQEKYKNKKDQASQQKQQAEIQQLYQQHGVNPFGSCLPLLVQFPIIMGLFQVLRNIPAYIGTIKVHYADIVAQIVTVDGYGEKLTTLMESDAVLAVKNFDPTVADKVIDLLYKFRPEHWTTFNASFSSIADAVEPIQLELNEVYNFFTINLADSPQLLSIGILIPILNIIAQFLVTRSSMKRSKANSAGKKKTAQESQMEQTNKAMMYTMPLITAFFVMTMPAGLGLYWLISSIFAYVQQVILNHRLDAEFEKRKAEIEKKKSKKKPVNKVNSNKNGNKSNNKNKQANTNNNTKKKPAKQIETNKNEK